MKSLSNPWRVRAASLVVALAAGASVAGAHQLQVAVSDSPAGLDPHIATAFNTFQVIEGTIYEGLTDLGADLAVVPGLASAWTISDDLKTYTFDLRDGVAFHSGKPMTSADVVASLERVMDERTGSPLASRLSAVETVTAPDDDTVVITLSAPSAPLLTSLTTIAIVPQEYREDTGTLQQTPDGTGPFELTEWRPNVSITLTANPDYWEDGFPALDGVTFNIVPEAATRQVGLASGQYELLPNIDAVTALQLQSQPGIKLEDTLELAYSLIGLNVSRPPLDNPKVREAINYAINRDDIVAAALFGAGVPGGPLSPALETFATPVGAFPCYATDPGKAASLLAEAGLETPTSLELLVLPRDDTKAIAQLVQQELGAIGIEVTLKIPETGQFVQDWRNSNFDMFVSLNGGTTEPDDYFYRTFKTGGSTNVFKFSDPALDAMLEAGRSEVDQDKRVEIYRAVQDDLACDGPVVFLAYGQLYTAMRDNVSGFEINPNRSLGSLKSVSVD